MRKILISFLGAGQKKEGQYSNATYKIDKDDYETTFVAKALCDHFQIDHTIMFGTAKSIWDEFYTVFEQGEISSSLKKELFDMQCESKNTTELSSIKAIISKIDLQLTNVSTECIKYGLNPEELQYNFEQIVNAIKGFVKSGDEIYLDITHSFRSIPAFATPIVNYLVDILPKEISIKGIYYGMLDVHRELKYAPIVNLNSTLEINMWMKAANTFDKHNNFSEISALLGDELLDKSAKCLVTSIGINSVSDVRRFSEDFISQWNSLLESEYIDKSKLVYIDLIRSTVLRYPNMVNDIKQDWELLLYMANEKWNSGQTVGAITCIWEAMISRLAKALKIEDYISNNYKELSAIIRNYDDNSLDLKDLSRIATRINNIRNIVVHADGGRSKPNLNVSRLVHELPMLLKDIEVILRSSSFDNVDSNQYPELKYEHYRAKKDKYS